MWKRIKECWIKLWNPLIVIDDDGIVHELDPGHEEGETPDFTPKPIQKVYPSEADEWMGLLLKIVVSGALTKEELGAKLNENQKDALETYKKTLTNS